MMGDISDDIADFEQDEPLGGDNSPRSAFVVDLDGFEGPIDVLLSLARDHKLDLTAISILALAEQYLLFVAEARRLNLDLAADYLVMAAWLAFLKSRLLLPDMDDDDEPSGEEMAAALAFQLKRLQAMQRAGEQLMARDGLGRGYFPRGNPEKFATRSLSVIHVTLFDVLKAYGQQLNRKNRSGPLEIEAFSIFTVEDALQRLRKLVGHVPDWQDLWHYLPDNLITGSGGELRVRSAVASTFAATLELAKEGKLKLRQGGLFQPIQLKMNAGDDPN